ncbi:uncharacterized protein DUF4142 [Phyllobacterium bourgognense]|uniref:Uncharacterized protein DUF4142 n=1 Tax=Phyllobacterium bourgognense TaxID=314236 RepID=A0A368YIS0_9HYPH|nr:uncharacterized protein DUF4142 [Phyllobacterium bourgognense]
MIGAAPTTQDFVLKAAASDMFGIESSKLDLFERYGDGGENADLKARAAKTRPDLEHHLMMAEDLNK